MRLDRAGSACSFLPVPVSRPSWPFPSPSRHENKKEDRQRQGSPRQVDIDRSEAEGSLVTPFRVILLPGSVLPAELAYGSLAAALGSDADAVAKDLEVYATKEARSITTWISRSPARSAKPLRGGGSGSIWSATQVVAPRHLPSSLVIQNDYRASPSWSRPGPAVGISARQSSRSGASTTGSRSSSMSSAVVHAPQRQAGRRAPSTALWRPSALDGEASRRDQRIHSDVSDLRPRSRCSRTIRSTRLLRARRAEQPRSVRRDRDPTQRGLSRFST